MKVKFINRGMTMFRGGGEQFDMNIASALQKLRVDISFVSGKPLFSKMRCPLTEFRTIYCSGPPYFLYHPLLVLPPLSPSFTVPLTLFNGQIRILGFNVKKY